MTPVVITSVTRRAGRVGTLALALDRRPGVAGGAACSTTVENSPHFGQRPYHRPDVAPHDSQRYTVELRAMRANVAPEADSVREAQPSMLLVEGTGIVACGGDVDRLTGTATLTLPAWSNVKVIGTVLAG